jgi:2-oxo-4-hydroxy-4-carboxy-5-ureidoimidazoline decarboxylase
VDPVEGFNGLPAERAERELLACCAAPAWAHRVVAGRPYPDRAELLAAGDAAARALSWSEVESALAAHPRIGERPTGPGREAAWSRREQAGVATADLRQALAEANRTYEERFGHIFLIFASGKSDAEMLAAARARLGHDDDTERATVREELRKIALLRLERLVDEQR